MQRQDGVGKTRRIGGDDLQFGAAVGCVMEHRVGQSLTQIRHQPVALAVRPEDVRLVAGPNDVPNSVTAQVEWVEFLGSTYRIDLILEGDEDQKLKVELSANVMREMNLSKGMRLPVVLPAELLWVYEV